MNFRQLRVGETLALLGAIAVLVSLFVRNYYGPAGDLDAWNTFGPGVVLLLAAVCAALAMVVSALTERSPALPVSTAVWCVLLGLVATCARWSDPTTPPRSASAHGWRSRGPSRSCLARGSRCATNGRRCTHPHGQRRARGRNRSAVAASWYSGSTARGDVRWTLAV